MALWTLKSSSFQWQSWLPGDASVMFMSSLYNSECWSLLSVIGQQYVEPNLVEHISSDQKAISIEVSVCAAIWVSYSNPTMQSDSVYRLAHTHYTLTLMIIPLCVILQDVQCTILILIWHLSINYIVLWKVFYIIIQSHLFIKKQNVIICSTMADSVRKYKTWYKRLYHCSIQHIGF